jgi:hypothetical protein
MDDRSRAKCRRSQRIFPEKESATLQMLPRSLDHGAPTPDVSIRRAKLARSSLCVALLSSALAAGGASGLGLDQVSQQSALGERLRLVIPVIDQQGDELTGECVKVVPAGAATADGVPEILAARVAVERTRNASYLVVTTTRPVNDPVIRVTVQAGCDRAIRREYTLLLDPVPIDAPVVAEAPAARGEPPATVVAPAGATAAPSESRAAARERAAPSARAAIADSAATPPRRATQRARPAVKAPVDAPRKAETSQPRIEISRSVLGTGAPGKGTGDATATMSRQELANALDEETVVLRQRITELSAAIERMQQELIAVEAARKAAEEAARQAQGSPWATFAQRTQENWPLVALPLGAVVLIAGGLAWRRRRDAAHFASSTSTTPASWGGQPHPPAAAAPSEFGDTMFPAAQPKSYAVRDTEHRPPASHTFDHGPDTDLVFDNDLLDAPANSTRGRSSPGKL